MIAVDVEIGADADPAETAAKKVSELREQVSMLQQQVNQMQSAAQGGMEGMNKMGDAAEDAGFHTGSMRQELAQATEGISEIVIMVGEAIGALGEFAVAVAGVVQEMGLLHDQLTTAGGEELVGVVDELSQKLPETKEQIAATAVKLEQMGMSADQAKKAITAMSAANAESAGSGDKLLAVLQKMQMGAKLGARDYKALAAITGMSVKQIQAELSKGGAAADAFMAKIEDMATSKGATVLADKMNDLGVIWDKFKERVFDLFTGIAQSPGYKAFIAAVQQLFHLFDSQTVGAKDKFTSAFSTMFAVAAKVLTWMEIALLKVATFGVRAYIWAFPFIKKLKELWQEWGMSEKMVQTLKVIGAILGGMLVAAIATVVTTLALMTAGIMLVVQAGMKLWGWIAAIISGLAKVISAIVDFVKGAIGALMGWVHGAEDAAAKFVAGLMGGLMAGIPGIKDASKKLGDAANSALKDAMKVQSPSKVTMEIGQNIGAGLAIGMGKSENDVIAAAESMGGASVPTGGGRRGGGGGITVNIQAGAIVINARGGESVKELTEQALVEMVERVVAAEAA